MTRWLWAPRAWLPGDGGAGREGWRDDVLLGIDAAGRWCTVEAGVHAVPEGAIRLAGAALPGLVDAHSHAFQRAFAGLAERREADEADDFWSWRARMYATASRITPEHLRAVAAQLFVELLQGGYTQVCEFHYLQHRPDGSAYDDPLAFSWALADAAADAGIGLTVLPVLYERAGFDGAPLGAAQQRFALDADGVRNASKRLLDAGRPLLDAGLAIHSLRAASPRAIDRLSELADGFDGPIHIHAAEQTKEVADCLAATGSRPLAWLARHARLDARWQLVHATHAEPSEIDAVAACGAGVVLCPGTEANLGDGLADLPRWLACGAPLSIGSDSNVTRDWREELRWLEYGQRLARRERNVSAGREVGTHVASTAERLFRRSLAGGGAASSQRPCGLRIGARADLLVADPRDPAALGVPAGRLLDAIVFSSPQRPWRDVMVAGRFVIREGRHAGANELGERFEAALQALRQTD